MMKPPSIHQELQSMLNNDTKNNNEILQLIKKDEIHTPY